MLKLVFLGILLAILNHTKGAVLNGDEESLLLITGVTTGSSYTSTIQSYSLSKQVWSTSDISNQGLPGAMMAASAVTLNDTVYLAGGLTESQITLNTVYAYNKEENSWKLLTKMMHARSFFGLQTLDGLLYAFGGSGADDEEEEDPADKCEYINLKTRAKVECESMHKKRVWLATATVGGKIYAIGGSPFLNGSLPVRSVERYDPKSDTWTIVAPMKYPRIGAVSVVHNGKIYVTGSMGKYSREVEVYDPETNKWTQLARMKHGRMQASMFVMNDMLVVFGGNEFGNILKTVEMYDFVKNRWELARSKYNLPIPIYSAASVSLP